MKDRCNILEKYIPILAEYEKKKFWKVFKSNKLHIFQELDEDDKRNQFCEKVKQGQDAKIHLFPCTLVLI